MTMAVTNQPQHETLAVRPREAARMLGISERTLYSYSQRGEIPHIRMGRVVLYSIPALRKWLDDRAAKKGGSA